MFRNFLLLLIASVITFAIASDEELWNKFKSDHKKSYESPEEDSRRFQTFQNNLRLIEENNKKYDAGEVSYKLGINQFSDLNRDEFKMMHTGKIPINH